MIEVPCTLRCDNCRETTPAVAETKHVGIGPSPDKDLTHVFVITDKVLPAGWRVVFDELRCPRCNGAK